MNYEKSSMHLKRVTVVSMMLLAVLSPTVLADVFPAEPFNGLQVSYSVSGATLSSPVDSEGFTTSRSITGTLDGYELTVSGVATATSGWGASIDVSVSVDGQEGKKFHEEKFPKNGLAESAMSQPFTVTVPVPSDAKAASFTISLEGSYNAGSRGVVVDGSFDRSSSSGSQNTDAVGESGSSDSRFKAKPSKDLKLYKILQLYQQKIPNGIASSGNRNNLLSWIPYSGNKYDEFKCGGYQSRVLKFLDSLKFSDDPEERALPDEWDYGPIEAYYGGHQAVVIYPKGTDWVDSGIVLDPWISQKPEAYTIHGWAGMFSEGTFHGIRGSSVYEGTPEYPTVGGDYVNPNNKKRSPEELDFLKNLPPEKKKIYERLTEDQKGAWLKTKIAEQNKNGRAMGYSPLNLYVEDEEGLISGFPDGAATWEIPDVSMRRFPLDDGTYWTELEYPLNRSYNLVVEGTGEGDADVFTGYGMDDEAPRSMYKYHTKVVSGQRLEEPVDLKGGSLSSDSKSIESEEIQEIDQSWLDSKSRIAAPPEYEVNVEDASEGEASEGEGISPVTPAESSKNAVESEKSTGKTQIAASNDEELVFLVGDIDNLGFGWPQGFDVFSGSSTPTHAFPWKPGADDLAGTDRIMVGTSYDGHPPAGQDGYVSSTSRPDNQPQAIIMTYDPGQTKVKSAILQMFVDDFQSPVWKSKFQAEINGRQAPFLEDVLNSLVQTGPIGKLITVQIPDEFLGDVAGGVLNIYIDDPTTGAGDGYAVDFVRLLINPKTMTNTGTVSGKVSDEETGELIQGATASASGVIKSSTDVNGEYILDEVPAGLVAVTVSKSGYVSQTKTADLTSGGDAELDFQCKKM